MGATPSKNIRNLFPRLHWVPSEDHVAVTRGGLDPERVLAAYREGVFPWYDEGMPVMWWSPDPRGVISLDTFHVSRRLARTLRTSSWRVSINEAFEKVMRACDEDRGGSWIHEDMVRCYTSMHEQGHAHSVEVWDGNDLVGGTYGVAFGGAFAAESKFHRDRDASKIALAHLVQHLRYRGFVLLDVQFVTQHLKQFGSTWIPRSAYLQQLQRARELDVTMGSTLLMRVFGEPRTGVRYVPRPGVYAVALDESRRVAIMRTSKGVFLPGGGVEGQEGTRATLKREVLEECGCEVTVEGALGAAAEYMNDGNETKKERWIKECTFMRATLGAKVSVPIELDHELVWCERDEARSCLSYESHAWAVARAMPKA